MKKTVGARRENDDLEIPAVDPEFFAHAVMGRHYAKVMEKSNIVRIAPDISAIFPNEIAVNQALRELVRIRESLTALTSNKAKRRKIA